MPYAEIRSGLWQELSCFSSVSSAESSSMGLCIEAGTHSPNCWQMYKYKSPSRYNASLLSLHLLIVSVYIQSSCWNMSRSGLWCILCSLGWVHVFRTVSRDLNRGVWLVFSLLHLSFYILNSSGSLKSLFHTHHSHHLLLLFQNLPAKEQWVQSSLWPTWIISCCSFWLCFTTHLNIQ